MKLLVIDDHPVVLEGLAALLRNVGPDATVLTARDAKQGLATLDTTPTSTSSCSISTCRA